MVHLHQGQEREEMNLHGDRRDLDLMQGHWDWKINGKLDLKLLFLKIFMNKITISEVGGFQPNPGCR